MGAYTRQYFGLIEGFDDVIQSAGFEGFNFLGRFPQGAYENDGHVPSGGHGLQPAADFEAVHPRHANIEQYQVGHFLRNASQGHLTAVGQANRVSRVCKYIVKQLEVQRDIIHNQDVGALGVRVSWYRGAFRHDQFSLFG